MLKKLSSIFFLSLILLFNYGKAVIYLHCRIENFIATGSTYCDCEKQITDNADINQNNTAQKTTFKEKGNDNIFAVNHQFALNRQNKPSSAYHLDNTSHIQSGFLSNIFQPPKA
ncbi:MAG TPA: hypothetical protein VKT28_07430 [Puia sp.]|nr:hypothetical protein [Puia sp.]